MLKVIHTKLAVVLVLASIEIQAAPLGIRSFVLPAYNELARRAVIQGTVSVELTGIEGKVNKVEILSSELSSPSAPKISSVPDFMANGIIEDLGKWEFEQRDLIKFRISIIFRLVARDKTSGNLFYRFSVQGDEGRPTEIFIEAEWPRIIGEPHR